MGTKTTKTSTVKAKADKTTAPKLARARKEDLVTRLQPPAHAEIAVRAYERFCARGYQHGYDVDDWLAAERELSAQGPA